MVVTVIAFGNLRRYLPGKDEKAVMQVPDGISISELIDYLEIPMGEFWFATVGDNKVKDDYRLSDGEEITLFNPVEGG